MQRDFRDKLSEVAIRDSFAGTYDSQYSDYRNAVEYMSVFKGFEVRCSDSVLEVGSGTGRFTRKFVEKSAEVVALDYSEISSSQQISMCLPPCRG